MNIIQAKTALQAYMAADIPVFIWGPPGIGKSDMVRQVGADLGGPVVDIRATLLDPVDFRGIPTVVDGRTMWAIPDFLPRADRDGPVGALFLDELNAAPQSVQAALFQLILDRKLGEYVFPSGWRIVAAGNRQTDRAAAVKMPTALANRFAHIDVEPDIKAWLDWAAGAGLDPVVPAFLQWKPDALHSMGDGRAFPSPRAWASVAKLAHHATDTLAMLAAGLVGDGPAAEFVGFVRIFRTLPPVGEILANPDTADVPAERSARFGVAMAVARAADHGNIDAVATYLRRLQPEFMVCGMRQAVSRNPDLKSTAAYVTFAVDQQAMHI